MTSINYKTAVLVQAHNDCHHIINLARENQTAIFFIHIDKKKLISPILQKSCIEMDNLKIIEDRVAVFWGGSSQVKATLILLSEALKFKTIEYFHLISGECLLLKKINDIEKEWDINKSVNFIECRKRKDVEWRLRINVFYLNTNFTRTLMGRVFNNIYKLFGRNFNFTGWRNDLQWYGSQWFSINRGLAEKINTYHKKNNYFAKFRYKPCCDEHAFQIFIKEIKGIKVINENKRYINFSKNKSSPNYINDINCLKQIRDEGYWFCRKVTPEVINKYLNE